MANWGFKISQEGFDVKNCADKDLIMSSSLNMLKTASVGTVGATNQVAHGMAYTPVYFISNAFGGGKHSLIGEVDGAAHIALYTGIDDTNLYSPEGSKYYIFYNAGIE